MSFDIDELFNIYSCLCDRNKLTKNDVCHNCRCELDLFNYAVFNLDSHYCPDRNEDYCYSTSSEPAYEKWHHHLCKKCYTKYLEDIIERAKKKLEEIKNSQP